MKSRMAGEAGVRRAGCGRDSTAAPIAVASAIWVTRPEADQALVFIDIDGEPVRGG